MFIPFRIRILLCFFVLTSIMSERKPAYSGTDKSRHTYTEKGCDTQEDERHSDLIFDIFDANLWVYFRKPQEGVSLFVHVTLSSPDIPQNSLSCRNFLAPVHPLMSLLIPFGKI